MPSPIARIAQHMTRLGISEREAQIYLALLERGPQSVVGIAGITKLNRPAVYEVLPHLESSGLISRTKKGKRDLIVANHPDMLRSFVAEAEEQLQRLVDELRAFADAKHTTTDVAVLYGRSGIQSVFNDLVETLPVDGIFYRFSGPDDLSRADGYLPPEYRKRRDAKRLERYVITRSDIEHSKKPRLERDTRVLHGSALGHDLTKLIYADRVAYIDYTKEKATIVYDATIAAFERELFMDLWKTLRAS